MRRHLLVLFTFILAACAAAPTPTPTLTPTPPPTLTSTPEPTAAPPPQNTPAPLAIRADPAYLHIVHAAPTVETVDFYIGQVAVAPNIRFSGYTNATPISAGTQLVRMLPGGARFDSESLLETTIDIAPGQTALLLLADAQKLVLVPETAVTLSEGESALRLVHAAAGRALFTVNLNNSAAMPVRPGEVTTAQIIPAGELSIEVETGGTVLAAQRIQLQPRHTYTLVLVGSGDTLETILLDAALPSGASVRVVHAAAPLGAIAAYVGSQLLTPALPFGRASERLPLSGGTYDLTLYPANSDPQTAPPLVSQRVQVSAGNHISLILSGADDDLTATFLTDDLSPTPPEMFRLSFFNALPGVPSLQVGEELSLPFTSATELRYAGAPASVMVEAGQYDFVWAESDGAEAISTVRDLLFDAGQNYLYLFAGAADEPFIVSDEVGIRQSVAADAVANTADPTAAQLYFVNALSDGSEIDFAVDGEPVARLIPLGGMSDAVQIEAGEVRLAARAPDSGSVRAQLDLQLEAGGRYVVYAWRSGGSTAALLSASLDGIFFNNDSGRIRLVNLSPQSDVEFSLATTDALPTEVAVPASEWESGDLRMSLPFGNQLFLSNVAPGSVSEAVSIFTGQYDVMIVDESEFGIARQLNAVPIPDGQLVDIVAFMAMTTRRVDAFTVAYPAPSD